MKKDRRRINHRKADFKPRKEEQLYIESVPKSCNSKAISGK